MRSVILHDEFHETDFKPSPIFQEYLDLLQKDLQRFFIENNELYSCRCPACDQDEGGEVFQKYGMRYVECSSCGTLRVSPRPNDESIQRYYLESDAEKFWREKLSHTTAGKRQTKIIDPRMQWLIEANQEYLQDTECFVDFNTNYGYAKAIHDLPIFDRKILLNPFLTSEHLKEYPNLQVIQGNLEEIALEKVDAISLFEVLDQTADIGSLLKKIHAILQKGGICLVTTILASGFDLLTLGKYSDKLIPPDRLNVFSLEGIKNLFQRSGFEILELSTPGILDLEIVSTSLKKNPNIPVSRFVQYLLEHRDSNVKSMFQDFLQASLLSSYGRILLQKV